MKWLQGAYTQRFHAHNRTSGHLFQGRYKALLVQDAPDYFPVVADYVHLNPARARLFDLERGKLTDYRWSSYPLFFRPRQRPGWLHVAGVPGAHDVTDDPRGRARYRRQMRQSVLNIAQGDTPAAVEAQWDRIRRGWSFGTAAFRGNLLEKLDCVIGGRGKRASYAGEQTRMHDAREARRLPRAGLSVLGMRLQQLRGMRFNAPEKCLLAWLLRRNTSVSNAWICERLHMGRVDCFSRYPKQAEQLKGREAVKLRKQLAEITKIRD